MDVVLITSAALLGLAGTPHCAAMCAAPCAAATAGQGRAGLLAFHGARVASYTVVGALAAASVETLATWSQWSPALRPLWTLLHAAAFALGLWLLWQGRQPAWMGRWGRMPSVLAAPAPAGSASAVADDAGDAVAAPPPVVHQLVFSAPGSGMRAGLATARLVQHRALAPAVAAGPRPWAAFTAGALWAAWPCGLLQSALLVAALAGSAGSGAAAMALFALASSAGLVLGPWAWRRWLAGPNAAARERGLARLGGGLLAAASGWSLTHDFWHRAAVWCGLA